MCKIVPAKVYDLLNLVLGLVAILWCFIIYGANKGNYPQCDREHLEKWYLIYAVVGVMVYPMAVCITKLALIVRQERDSISPVLLVSIFSALCLFIIITFFLLAWWITGNVWIWNSNDSDFSCGELTKSGKKLLIYQYATMGFMIILACFKQLPEGTAAPGSTEPTAVPPVAESTQPVAN